MTVGVVLDLAATAVFAASGALAARGKQIDLFGVIVLGLVTAVGGGTLRDLLLDTQIAWIRQPSLLYTAVTSATAMFFIARWTHPPYKTLEVLDAFGLAFVTMLGTSKAESLGHAAPVCVAMGLSTGVAGGILRDMLCNEVPFVFRVDINLYATAAFFGALAYLGLTWWGLTSPWNLIAGATVVLVLRLAGIRWKLRLPVFEMPER